jgi:hypothetical protein
VGTSSKGIRASRAGTIMGRRRGCCSERALVALRDASVIPSLAIPPPSSLSMAVNCLEVQKDRAEIDTGPLSLVDSQTRLKVVCAELEQEKCELSLRNAKMKHRLPHKSEGNSKQKEHRHSVVVDGSQSQILKMVFDTCRLFLPFSLALYLSCVTGT